jgi:hypothetical protein
MQPKTFVDSALPAWCGRYVYEERLDVTEAFTKGAYA